MIKDFYLRKFIRFLINTEFQHRYANQHNSNYLSCKNCGNLFGSVLEFCPRHSYSSLLFPDEKNAVYSSYRNCTEIYGLQIGKRLEKAFNNGLLTIRKDRNG